MKTTLLIIAILTFALIIPQGIFAKTDNYAAVDSMLLQKQVLKNVTIITPHSEIYDDGALKKTFCGYTLSDTDNNSLIKVKPVKDIPVTLKVMEGTYIIRLNNENPTSYYIKVTAQQSHEFLIP